MLKLVIAIVTGAIARGVILLLGLDAKIARILRTVKASPNSTAIAWILSGAIGVVGVIGWEMLSVSERLDAVLPFNRPGYGSLPFKDMIVSIERHPSGKTDIQMSVELKNTNDFMLRYNALLIGRVNGKLPNGPILTFEGYIPANETRYMMYNKIFDVPPQTAPGSPVYEGYIDYDVTYSAASSSRGIRHTARRASFSTFQGAQKHAAGTRIQDKMMVRLTNEIEE